MNKKFLISLIAILVFGLAIAVTFFFPVKTVAPVNPVNPTGAAVFNPLYATYEIDGQSIALVGGKFEAPAAPGSAQTITVQAFGLPVVGDLNGDGKSDAALFLVENSGGSGTFYYVAVALATATGTQGTNAILLGDRIAPQTLEIQDGNVLANYADRKPGEPMTAQPSVGVTKYLTVQGTELVATAPAVGAGEHCGGNMLNATVCSAGYHCAPTPGSHLPFGDVGGTCVAD